MLTGAQAGSEKRVASSQRTFGNRLLGYAVQWLFALLPDTRLYPFKAALLRLRGFEIGANVRVVSSVKLKLRLLAVGDNTFISHDTLIEGGDVPVRIGRNVDVGPGCVIVTGSHEIGDSSHRAAAGRSDCITIGDGTWIGAHATILGGVRIGRGCIVAAGSLVRKDVDDNSLVAGVPARTVRQLP